METGDLAEGTFLQSVHPTIRWLLLIPISLIAGLGAGAIVRALGFLLFSGGEPSGFLGLAIDTLSSAALGAVLVYAAALTAPRKQFAVAVIAYGVLSLFAVLSFTASFLPVMAVSKREITLHSAGMIVAGALIIMLLRKVDFELFDS